MVRIIAVIKKDNVTVGYRLLDVTSKQIRDCTVDEALYYLSTYANNFIHGKVIGGSIELFDGSINSLPVLDADTLRVIDNDCVIVIARRRKGEAVLGYIVTDYSGVITELTEKEFMSYENVGYYNAKIVNRDGKKIISAIKGSFFEIQMGVDKVVSKESNRGVSSDLKDSNILKGLNEAQREAVMETEGYIRLIAGAGTGKTRVLTTRVAYLVSKGVDPSEVLSVTFTNKAAKEMRERAAKLLGISEENLYMKTFHSLCLDILREDVHLLNWENTFSVGAVDIPAMLLGDYLEAIYGGKLNAKELKFITKELEKDINKLRRIDFEGKGVNKHINYLTGVSEAEKIDDIRQLLSLLEERKRLEKDNVYMVWRHSKSPMEKLLSNIFIYQAENFYMQFDDILKLAYHLLSTNGEVLKKWQGRFKYIQVDEFQDTDNIQFEIIKLLAVRSGNLFVVGDPDQSIYEFRQAKPEILVKLDERLPNVKTITMNTNYRSCKEVTRVSNHVIKGYEGRIDKDLVAYAGNIGRKPVIIYESSVERAVAEALKIIRGKLQEGVKQNEIAILYDKKTSLYYTEVLKQLDASGIKYKLYMNTDLASSIEYEFFVSFLRLLLNNGDILGWTGLLDSISIVIGIKNVEGVVKNIRVGSLKGVHPVNSVKGMLETGKLAVNNIKKLEKIIEFLGAIKLNRGSGEFIGDMLGLLYYVFNAESVKESKVIIDDIIKVFKKLFYEDIVSKDSLGRLLLDFVVEAEGKDIESEEDENKVQVMTMHKAKGLEFDVVFCTDVNYGMLPNAVSDEGYRLMFVAFSRAKKELYVLCDSGFKVTGKGRTEVKVEKGPSHYITIGSNESWGMADACGAKWDFFCRRNEDFVRGKRAASLKRKEERDMLYNSRVYKVMDEV